MQTRPIVHLDGTSRDELQRQYTGVILALGVAQDALKATAPHGRDYYVQPEGTYQQARKEYAVRASRLHAVEMELQDILEGLVEKA